MTDYVKCEICDTCKWYDSGYGICRHPAGSKSFEDVGELDWCKEWESNSEVE